MQRHLSAFAFAVALMFGGVARAQENTLSARLTPWLVSLQQEPAGYEDPFYSAFVTAGENKFTFVIPQGFRIAGEPVPGRLALENREGTRFVTFTILNPGSMTVTAESCRAVALKRHGGGTILRESTVGVAGATGPIFDVQWKAAEDIYQCERVAFIPTSYGTLIFSASSGRPVFPETQGYVGLLMGTFRATTDGKFRPIHLSATN